MEITHCGNKADAQILLFPAGYYFFYFFNGGYYFHFLFPFLPGDLSLCFSE